MIKLKRKKIFIMILTTVCILIGLWLLNSIVEWVNMQGEKKVGVTYSPKYAEELGLNAQDTYIQMLDELQVKYLRFPIYWDEVERYQGVYNFENADWYIKEAGKRGVKINLVLGYKQPRWPECFAPKWTSELQIKDFSQEVLGLVETEVKHFKQFPNISHWQVENEPTFPFGLCNKPDPTRLDLEIAIVRANDPRPIIITESGELTDWTGSMKRSDRLGISIYRTVWNPWIGLVDYPLPATFYSLKNLWSSIWSGRQATNSFVAELQSEAWGTNSRGLRDIPKDELSYLFPAKRIETNLEYAKKTGFDEIYLWGVEWWYMMEKLGDRNYIDAASRIF